MKAIYIIITTCLIGAVSVESAQGQMSQYKFNQVFQQAFTQVLVGEYEEAIPVLEKLNTNDPSHAQVAFFLGMSYLKSGENAGAAVEVLEKAIVKCSPYHQLGRVEDKSAPCKTWFFLAEAYAKSGQLSKAVEAYREYMSTIPFATLDSKREIIAKIQSVKKQLAHNELSQPEEVSMLAKLKL